MTRCTMRGTMVFDRIYGPLVPCACGQGMTMPYRLQDAELPIESGPFDAGAEIDCEKCDPGFQTWRLEDRASKLRARGLKAGSRKTDGGVE